jgi:hypothetical protein
LVEFNNRHFHSKISRIVRVTRTDK